MRIRMWMGALACTMVMACGSGDQKTLTIQGKFGGAAGKKIFLAELPFQNTARTALDSATLDSTGTFTLSTLQMQEGIYQLFIGGGPGLLLINDANNITVHAQLDSLSHYRVEGSPASHSLKKLFEQYMVLEEGARLSARVADSIAHIRTMPDSLKAPYLQAAKTSAAERQKFLLSYLQTEKNPTALWYALGLSRELMPRSTWQPVFEKLLEANPHHPGLMIMKTQLSRQLAFENAGKALIGKPMPAFALQTPAGQTVQSATLRGRWTLLDFWASWCGPCRAQNPELVKTYHSYKNQGLQITGISLDHDKNAWQLAITNDSLPWLQLSDLQGWESPLVEKYGLQAIPFNALVDSAGIVRKVNVDRKDLDSLFQQ